MLMVPVVGCLRAVGGAPAFFLTEIEKNFTIGTVVVRPTQPVVTVPLCSTGAAPRREVMVPTRTHCTRGMLSRCALHCDRTRFGRSPTGCSIHEDGWADIPSRRVFSYRYGASRCRPWTMLGRRAGWRCWRTTTSAYGPRCTWPSATASRAVSSCSRTRSDRVCGSRRRRQARCRRSIGAIAAVSSRSLSS